MTNYGEKWRGYLANLHKVDLELLHLICGPGLARYGMINRDVDPVLGLRLGFSTKAIE